MVTASVPSVRATFNGSRFIKIQDAAQFLGVSLNTRRSLADSGELGPIHRTLGNHRRLEAKAVWEHAYGVSEDECRGGASGKLIAVIRVSSKGQDRRNGSSDKTSLDHQRERIIAYCLEKYGREPDEILESIGSGLNFDRPELLNLIERITSGELCGATIVCTDFTRLARFGIRMIEHLCELGEVEIVYTMDEREAKTENETLVDDILSIMTHFTANVSGNKARKALKVIMDPDSLQEAYRLYKQGYSYRYISKVLLAVSKAISGWDADSTRGSFRAWLFRVARNLMINFLAKQRRHPQGVGDTNFQRLLAEQPAPESEDSAGFELEYRRRLSRWTAEHIFGEFQPSTWKAFWKTCVEGRGIQEVAAELQLSAGAVYVARSRVMARLRKRIGQIEDE